LRDVNVHGHERKVAHADHLRKKEEDVSHAKKMLNDTIDVESLVRRTRKESADDHVPATGNIKISSISVTKLQNLKFIPSQRSFGS
jgi:hypothetical protein